MAPEAFHQRLNSPGTLTERFKQGINNFATGLAVIGITALVAASFFGVLNGTPCALPAGSNA